MDLIQAQFVVRNSADNTIKCMVYISPSIIPNNGSGQLVVGNSVRVAIGGLNQDPIVPLIAAPYSVRIVGYQYDTQFDVDLTNAPTGSTVNVANYIV